MKIIRNNENTLDFRWIMSFFLRFNASCLNRVDCALPEIKKKNVAFGLFVDFIWLWRRSISAAFISFISRALQPAVQLLLLQLWLKWSDARRLKLFLCHEHLMKRHFLLTFPYVNWFTWNIQPERARLASVYHPKVNSFLAWNKL